MILADLKVLKHCCCCCHTTFEFSAVLSAPLCLFLVDFFFQMPFWVELGSSEKAHDGEGCLKQPKELSINKVGHGTSCHRLPYQ
jgi:hypothetical protein